jgi:hypothetical protein
MQGHGHFCTAFPSQAQSLLTSAPQLSGIEGGYTGTCFLSNDTSSKHQLTHCDNEAEMGEGEGRVG